MAKTNPSKSLLHNADPVTIPWNRLFLFWESYQKEFTDLLEKWHIDTVRLRRPDPDPKVPPRTTGNVLYDSFLDTWGKDKFEDDKVPLDQKSYFAALGDVSIKVRAECLKVLMDILETKDGDFTDPLKLKIPEKEANDLAQEKLDTLSNRFSNEFDALDVKIDPCVEKATKGSNDHYLEALLRMMRIETRCFEVQKHFLQTGKVLPGNP